MLHIDYKPEADLEYCLETSSIVIPHRRGVLGASSVSFHIS